MAMPKRPRAHVLEEESRRALRSILPADWVIADTNQLEYGLDARVEIFKRGVATGLAFWVQLKATDERDLSKALSVRCRVSSLNYWYAQADPVLLVRYSAP